MLLLLLLMIAVLLITVHSCFAGMASQHTTYRLKIMVSDYHHTHNAGMYLCALIYCNYETLLPNVGRASQI